MDSVVLFIHIAFGSVALLTAALAFLTKKGPKFHAKAGRIYAFAMIGVGLNTLWWMGSTDFLLFIAFFSTYMVLVGWRLGQNRRGLVSNIDQALMGIGTIGTLGLLFISADIAFGGIGPWGEEASFRSACVFNRSLLSSPSLKSVFRFTESSWVGTISTGPPSRSRLSAVGLWSGFYLRSSAAH